MRPTLEISRDYKTMPEKARELGLSYDQLRTRVLKGLIKYDMRISQSNEILYLWKRKGEINE